MLEKALIDLGPSFGASIGSLPLFALFGGLCRCAYPCTGGCVTSLGWAQCFGHTWHQSFSHDISVTGPWLAIKFHDENKRFTRFLIQGLPWFPYVSRFTSSKFLLVPFPSWNGSRLFWRCGIVRPESQVPGTDVKPHGRPFNPLRVPWFRWGLKVPRGGSNQFLCQVPLGPSTQRQLLKAVPPESSN